jgi:hypothetical protein
MAKKPGAKNAKGKYKNPTAAINSGKMEKKSGEIVSPGKIVFKAAAKLAGTKAVKTAKQVKNARATKDAKIVSSSPYLKQTPNMTIKQAKAMKQGTKQLSKTTKRISKESNRRKSDNVSVGEFNDFLKKMGLDKPTTFPSSGKMKALDTPSIGGKINAPSNMTLKDVNRASALDDAQKAKAYAAAYRVAKRETKGMKKAMESKKVRTTKKVVKGTAVAGTAGGAYAASKKKKGK